MSIFRKLILSFLGIALIFAAVAGISISHSRSIERAVERVSQVNLRETTLAAEFNLNLHKLKSNVRELLLESVDGREGDVRHAQEVSRQTSPRLSAIISEWELVTKIDLELSEGGEEEGEKEELTAINDMKVKLALFLPTIDKVISLEGGRGKARALFEKEAEPLARQLSGLASENEHDTQEETQLKLERISHEARYIVRFSIFGSIFAVVTALSLGFFISKYITDSLKQLTDATAAIALGNLGAKVVLNSNDELAQLGRSFNTMSEALQDKIRELEKTHRTLAFSEKLAAVGQLAAGVAHEINNPLGIILGFAQSVSKRIQNEADPLALPLKTIEREALRCKNLVQSLLVFSRTSKGAREELDLNSAVEGALPLISARTKTQNVELAQELGAELPKIKADKTQLQQIVVNLANNAVDAMQNGGTLTIATSLFAKRPGYVAIQVRDTGAGIPKEIQNRIFEPFFTTKEVGKGTGLGLSLVYEIVNKHAGTIELESEEGKGATFTVFLPVHSAATPGNA